MLWDLKLRPLWKDCPYFGASTIDDSSVYCTVFAPIGLLQVHTN